MFWLLGILLLIEVECSQEEPRCIVPNDHGRHPPGDVLACQSGLETEVCGGEVPLQNVLLAGLEERCKEEEEEGEEEEKSGCLFLLETSTRDKLTSREACALESAVTRSGANCVIQAKQTWQLSRPHQKSNVSLILLLKSLLSIKREARCDAEGWSNAGLERQHNLPCVQGLQVNGKELLTFNHDLGIFSTAFVQMKML